VSVTKDNHLAHYNLGVALYNSGRFDDGILHCNEALRINPDDEGTHLAVGSALVHLGRREDALSHFREALRINPASVTARQQIEAVDKRSEPTQ
jgi:tetratricopeptide (TPR) repeat protein